MTYTSAIIDLDGTVYRGDSLVENAAEGVRTVRNAGLSTLFVTNKPIDRREKYCEKLNALGIDCSSDDIITSATASADYLSAQYPEREIYVIGEDALVAELRAAGLKTTTDPERAGTVIASLDFGFDYQVLQDALIALTENDAVFVATNPDRTCPVDGGEIPDAAGMIGAIEGVAGQELDQLIGKPSNVILQMALERLGSEPEHCLMIGDRLGTDIRMGNQAGMETVLPLTGVTSTADLAESDVSADHVVTDLSELAAIVENGQ
ncbi:HAD-IIA family hydrolase [Haloarcula sp. H-GB5]